VGKFPLSARGLKRGVLLRAPVGQNSSAARGGPAAAFALSKRQVGRATARKRHAAATPKKRSPTRGIAYN